jgi:hypothetical protein
MQGKRKTRPFLTGWNASLFAGLKECAEKPKEEQDTR